MRPQAIRQAFVQSCEAELAALKPGNVHVHAEGHGMTVAEFRTSAEVAAGPLCAAGGGLGARVLGAVEATRAAVGQNTNLGILLLCAPLAMAAEQVAAAQAGGAGQEAAERAEAGRAEAAGHAAATGQGGMAARSGAAEEACGRVTLRQALRRVLVGAGAEDAASVFRAIALAAPGGLGDAPEHDVRAPARVGLDVAMAAAAGRDSIARQWVTGFGDILGPGDSHGTGDGRGPGAGPGLPARRDAAPGPVTRPGPPPRTRAGARAATGLAAHSEAVASGLGEAAATQLVFLRFLAALPDSHVARRHGMACAEAVRREAEEALRRVEDELQAGPQTGPGTGREAAQAWLLGWDASLKRRGINPGTSADLTVATLFAQRIEAWVAAGRR